MSATRPSRYVHGTAAAEQRRLATLNDLVNDASFRELGLRRGERILDLGSGLGQFARRMARATGPGGAVVGVERSAAQRFEALRLARAAGEATLVDFRPGDAGRPPLSPREWGSFDLVHARFLLEHVPDPGVIVRTMVRAARPGGRIVLQDDDHHLLRLHPEDGALERLWLAYVATYARHGNDAFVGRRLTGLLHAAGALPVRFTWLFFGGCAGEAHFPVVVENLAAILRGARREILATRVVGETEFRRGLAALGSWGRRPDASFGYALPWAEGVRPRAREAWSR